jgi:hypothetical protein
MVGMTSVAIFRIAFRQYDRACFFSTDIGVVGASGARLAAATSVR